MKVFFLVTESLVEGRVPGLLIAGGFDLMGGAEREGFGFLELMVGDLGFELGDF
jgi:hypothetical protein